MNQNFKEELKLVEPDANNELETVSVLYAIVRCSNNRACIQQNALHLDQQHNSPSVFYFNEFIE